MKKLKVKYADSYAGPKKLELPRKGDIGIDLYASEDVFIPVGEAGLIDLGVSVEIPEGFWLSFRDRSSMSKYTHVLAGVIDTSYRGPLMVRMLCHTVKDSEGTLRGIIINKGDKIAQMILRKDLNSEFELEEVEELSETERGDGGFGSTGS